MQDRCPTVPHKGTTGLACRISCFRHSARSWLLPLLLSLLTIQGCGWFQDVDEPVPAALVIGYRRMFNHDRTEHAYTAFSEAVQKSGSITLAKLERAGDTGEGYAIYTFKVIKSIYNPDGDATIHLYEGIPGTNAAGAAGSTIAPMNPTASGDTILPMPEGYSSTSLAHLSLEDLPTPALPTYELGLTYLLCLSRATDVYYPHPYFHNFNGIYIAANETGDIVQAVSADGEINLEKEKDTRSHFRDMESTTTYIQALLNEETSWKKGVYRYAGREIEENNPTVIAELSPYIAEVRTGKTLFQNRYVQEVSCTILEPYKGIFGQGSGPSIDESNSGPPTAVLPGSRTITVLFPSGLNVSPGKKWLVFLHEDAEYRVTSRWSAIPADGGKQHLAYLSATETALALPKEPETPSPSPGPEPTPKTWTVQDEYAPLLAQNKDVRGWIRLPGTIIDYPVLQANDNDWYLSRDIDGNKSVSGSIALDFRVDIQNLVRNTPVYGHNMKRGTMFHELVKYKKADYFRDNPTIEFHTLYEKIEWDVFAVYVVNSGYNYVITMNFVNDDEFQLFLDDIESRTMYPLPFEVTTADQVMTLVTCSYEFDGARTIIQARRRPSEVNQP